jgi:thiamine biosynthesis lipoprotein ApbE
VRGKSDQGFAWGIGVEDPLDGKDCAVFYCQDCAVNTSGGYRRKWKIQNEEYHHLVNPFS